MAIQMRRGEYSKFDPSKLLPGEVAVVMSGDTTTASGRGVYVCVSAGTVVRVPTVEDAVAMIADAYPEAKVTRYSGYAMLEVTAPDGTKTTARVNDGVSPSVAVTPIEGGNDVAITDADGTKTVRIMNGISAPRSLANLLTRSLPEASSQTVDDAAKTPLVGVTVYGKSTQDGTPTPDAPVAIESVDSLAIKAAGKNVTPFFSVPFEGAEGYWFAVSNLASYGTRLADGWAHLEFDARNLNVSPFLREVAIAPGATYTIMLEVRNATALTNCRLYAYTDRQSPFAATKSVYLTGEGTYRLTVTIKDDLSSRAITHVRIFIGGGSGGEGTAVNADFRLSMYEGDYGGGYVPSDSSVTTVDLQGHVLRSLPNGTRDEVTVDECGHAILTQRVGHAVLDGTTVAATERRAPTSPATSARAVIPLPSDAAAITQPLRGQFYSNAFHYSADAASTADKQVAGLATLYHYASKPTLLACVEGDMTVTEINSWLAESLPEVQYPLATPVTHDLGTILATPLPGPDLTVTTSPATTLALTYERDLNATLARLEAAIADAATA